MRLPRSRRSQLGNQYGYSNPYNQPLPTDSRGPWLAIMTGIATLLLVVAVAWWIIAGPPLTSIFQSANAPSSSSRIVSLTLAGQTFQIPQNYLRTTESRAGGNVKRIDIYAVWPSLAGYNSSTADSFADKSKDSQVIYLTLTAPSRLWRPAERFYQIYPYYFKGPERAPLYNLNSRRMDKNSGLGEYTIYYRQEEDRLFLFHCLEQGAELMPSDCFTDIVIEPNVLARFRFRRSALKNWREIDTGVRQLLLQFSGG